MAFKISECEDADMPRTFEIISEAFGTGHPLINVMWPHHHEPKGRVAGAQRWLEAKSTEKNAKFLKAVDTKTGEMVAQARWDFYNGVIPEDEELGGDHWDTEEDKELLKGLVGELLVCREKAIKDFKGELLCLDYLTVDPRHQRRGVGRELLRWGTTIADEQDVPCVLESPRESTDFYAAEGFNITDHIIINTDYARPWATKKQQEVFFMIRPRRSERPSK